jgi:hypothetical protein
MKDPRPPECPTPTAHKRLQEVHRFWHECAEGYQDPEEFRSKLNACVQAARNLTFALQKEGNLIPGFKDWYSTWQERMKTDPIMKWLHDARTQIVHKGDLATESHAIVRLQIDYADAGREVTEGLPESPKPSPTSEQPEIEADPLSSLDEILAHIAEIPLPARIRGESTITIERRWVDSNLPDRELLDVLAQAYGFLSQIIGDAHDRVGLNHGIAADIGDAVILVPELETVGGRLPCMVTSRARRTISLHLVEGTPATGGKMWSVEPDEAMEQRAAKKYRVESPSGLEVAPGSVIDMMPMYIKHAIAIVLSGEEHGWFVFFFRGLQPVGSKILMARDAADKRDLVQNIAEIVAVNHIDGIIEVGEVWQSPFALDPEGAFVRPAAHPQRTEAIAIWIETATGQKASAHIPITRRRFRRPSVGPVVQASEEAVQNNFLDPVRRVWASWERRQPTEA